jgi:hypothetical protein
MKKAMSEAQTAQAARQDLTRRMQQQSDELARLERDRAEALTRAEQAAKRLQDAEAALMAVAKELKANGFLTDGDQPNQLPAAIKAALASTDAKKATEALAAATRDVAAARAEAKTLAEAAAQAEQAHKAMVAKLTANAEQLQADMNQATQKFSEELAAAKKAAMDAERLGRQAALAEAAERERELRAKLMAEVTAREQELAAQAAQHEQVVATLRAGGKVVASARERAARERAAKAFADGVLLYQSGRYTEAEAFLMAATRDDPNDARYWYFLGLTRWSRGNPAAEAAFKHGAELEARGLPASHGIGLALERVQGPARQALAAYRP